MGHEITATDNVVLTGTPAWHGLGVVVEQAPTPAEALEIARLNWEVEQWPMSATNGDSKVAVPTHVANVRTDTKEILGIVGADWVTVQNRELAAFATELAEGGDAVRVETAGSIRGGRKVWFLLRADSFSVRETDQVQQYILLSNGFDGDTAIRGQFTGVRVVCSNTLHMVIPDIQRRSSGQGFADFVCHHTTKLKDRLEVAKKALKLYGRRSDEYRQMIDTLAVREPRSEAVRQFWLECYVRDFGPLAEVPTTSQERNARNRAQEALAEMSARWRFEQPVSGPSAWTAVNAYTGWLQHDKKPRVKDPGKARDLMLRSNLFGENAIRSVRTAHLALASLG